jgi:DNA processing protein
VNELFEAMQVSPLVSAPSSATAQGNALPTETDCTDLLAQLGHAPLDVDELLERTGTNIGQLSMGLLALEMAGMIERLPGGKVQRVYG